LEPNRAKGGSTGFAKRPVSVAVAVRAPGSQKGRSGLEGDAIGDRENHGGDDQAVYAFARGVVGWAKRFGADGRPGAYLSVVRPGTVQAGDPVRISHRPDHNVSVSMAFSAFTTSPGLLKGLFAAGDDLSDEMRVYVHSKLT